MNKKTVTYKYLATEYYNELKHPTCANFRVASKQIIKEMIGVCNSNQLLNVLEVGAGKSVTLEVLNELNINVANLIISDKDKDMLNYTRDSKIKGIFDLKQVNAEKMNFVDSTFNLIISSLGDPYNTRLFWNEISRVLVPGGICLFTSPSFEWSKDFRNNSSKYHFAEFLTEKNELVLVPSHIYEFAEQRKLIEESNLSILKTRNIELSQLTQKNISSKLITNKGDDLPIVTGYLVIKN